MKNKKIFCFVLCFAVAICIAVPGTLAFSADAAADDNPVVENEETAAEVITEEPAEEAGTQDETTGEEIKTDEEIPAADVSSPEEPSDSTQGNGLFSRLMSATTLEEFYAIAEGADEKEISEFTDEEFDSVEAYYIFLSTGEYPDYSPVVDESMGIVNFTNVAPLGNPVIGGEE